MDIKLHTPIRRLLPSECPNCNNDSLFIYDKNNNRINYSLLCKYNTFEQIERKFQQSDLRYMRCESCKSIFILDWTKQIIPCPNTKETYKEFEGE